MNLREDFFSRAIWTVKCVFAEQTGLLPKDVDNFATIPFRDLGFSIVERLIHEAKLNEEEMLISPKMTVQSLAQIALEQVLRDLRPPDTAPTHPPS